MVEQETAPQIDLPVARARQFPAAAQDRDTAAARRLLALAADRGDDYELHMDVLPSLAMETSLPILLDQLRVNPHPGGGDDRARPR
ncbi:hypothetical protein [Streptomyces chrestomyceticus]|uniref:hypothetical protein n=1 Tax=Streptomyces chrestomyceticus TaxID=68185 RepID=UPI0004C6122D